MMIVIQKIHLPGKRFAVARNICWREKSFRRWKQGAKQKNKKPEAQSIPSNDVGLITFLESLARTLTN